MPSQLDQARGTQRLKDVHIAGEGQFQQAVKDAPFKGPAGVGSVVRNRTVYWFAYDGDGQRISMQFPADEKGQEKALSVAAALDAYNHDRDAKQAAAVQGLVEALRALYLQSLQSDLNDHSNEYGREAIGLARAAIAAYEASR